MCFSAERWLADGEIMAEHSIGCRAAVRAHMQRAEANRAIIAAGGWSRGESGCTRVAPAGWREACQGWSMCDMWSQIMWCLRGCSRVFCSSGIQNLKTRIQWHGHFNYMCGLITDCRVAGYTNAVKHVFCHGRDRLMEVCRDKMWQLGNVRRRTYSVVCPDDNIHQQLIDVNECNVHKCYTLAYSLFLPKQARVCSFFFFKRKTL